MTLSRIAALLAAALLPTSAAAQTLTAEEAMAAHRRGLAAVTPGCVQPGDEDPEEVVICGRRSGPSMRLPLPVEPEPGARVRGEAASASRGLEPQRCTAWGPNQSCSGGLPLAAIATALVKGASKIADAVLNPD